MIEYFMKSYNDSMKRNLIGIPNVCFMNQNTYNRIVEDVKENYALMEIKEIEKKPHPQIMGCNIYIANLPDDVYVFSIIGNRHRYGLVECAGGEQ